MVTGRIPSPPRIVPLRTTSPRRLRRTRRCAWRAKGAVMFRRAMRAGVVRAAAAALEPLEARRHFTVDVGWTETVDGFSLSLDYVDESREGYALTVTGT